MSIIGRLAPSPTGAQHLGNARTHCIAYWAIRRAGGQLRLRIEDIDTPRIKLGAAKQAVDDLTWLGITWDGEPTYQTERRNRYEEVLSLLRDRNQIYPCTCSRRDVEQAGSAPHFEHESPIYAGTCSSWTVGDPVPWAAHCWRFRTTETVVSFADQCAGKQECVASKHLGDFPITQKTGDAAYQFAVVVDDYDSGINQVIRGNDLIVSTFRQILIHHALDWPIPTYSHVPLVIGRDGRRLAKRHGDTRLSQYRDRGIDPMQVVHWAAVSSGLIDQDLRIEHIDDVVEHFQWSKMSRQKTVVDANQFSPNDV